jgi:hypothetical protein
MPHIDREELAAACEWWRKVTYVTTRPHWAEEARVILRLKLKGRSLRRIAQVLTRIEHTPHNYETVNRRLAWAIETHKSNL